ncbi:hypothetical protein [Streptacidiphilus sp. EB129]|uniref:hypothetical protein n=1 Tax=Streptacidiphilus sp. EB129 TaxID=3156262 RepID=UPI0035168A72
MTTLQQPLFLDPTATAASAPGSQGALRKRFPPRTVPLSWPATEADRDQVLDRLTSPPFVPKHPVTASDRRRGLRQVLDWLGNQAGGTWQERWKNSGAEQVGGKLWRHLTEGTPNTHISTGLLILICADVIRPSTAWMLGRKLSHLQKVMSQVRDPDGLALLQDQAETDGIPGQVARMAGTRAAIILACKGGTVRDITVGDCVELLDTQDAVQSEGGGKLVLYQLLHRVGLFPSDAPSTIRAFRAALGQRSPEELVDQYQIACRPVRDLLVDYLRERQQSVDYATLRQLGRILAGLFWRDLEAHHPGIESLRLPPTVAAAWKQRLQTKESTSTDTAGQSVTRVSVRESARSVLITVRAFYLDLAQWAAEDPGRWAPWAVSSPITAAETNRRKERGRQKSRSDQRTRERLPVLPVLVKVADQRRHETATLLEDCRTVLPGTLFTAAGRTLLRPRIRGSAGIKVWAEEVAADPDGPRGPRRDLSWEEYDAFWAWAAIEVLRHTGIRIEELGELSHHSFIQYTLPSTGEVVPLLQIAPSKTDQERLLPVD